MTIMMAITKYSGLLFQKIMFYHIMMMNTYVVKIMMLIKINIKQNDHNDDDYVHSWRSTEDYQSKAVTRLISLFLFVDDLDSLDYDVAVVSFNG